MSGCCRTYNGACPDPVQVIQVLTAVTTTYASSNFSGSLVTLPSTPSAGHIPQVFVNGLLQGVGDHYNISGRIITFLKALYRDDVQVVYSADVA